MPIAPDTYTAAIMISFIRPSRSSTSNIKKPCQLHTKHQLVSRLRQGLIAFTGILWSILSGISDVVYDLYLLTIDDSPTFVIPNTIFGISAAMTASLLTTTDNGIPAMRKLSWIDFAYVLLRTLSFNWANLVIFDLANQRRASDEDKLNKPWRPIPSGRMTETRMRYWLIAAIPLVLGYSHFHLHVGSESCLLAVLTWMYNDLGGGDDNWLLRNWIIALAFGVYNLGSMKIAASSACVLSSTPKSASGVAVAISNLGYAWAVIISAVIFTTMHVQDLKDVVGDRARGRRSAPIVLGEHIASWTIAIPVFVWSVICVWFWDASFWICLGPVVMGSAVAWRCVTMQGKIADRRTWQMWCAWTAVLYLLPPLSG